MGARSTPLMQQFQAAKRAYPDSILFFRMGDFYELFEDDAVVASGLLELTLTSRNKGKPDEIPMAGFPHHAAHSYVAKLLEHGHKVAICEQMVDPSTVKGLVPREVIRVLTPGTVTDRDQLEAGRNNWLAALEVTGDEVGIALLDLSTAELVAAQVGDLTAVLGELGRAAPSEVVVGFSSGSSEEQRSAAQSALREVVGKVAFREDQPLESDAVSGTLGKLAGDAERLGAQAAVAAARALRFAAACNPLTELPVRRIGSWDPQSHLVIDPTAQRHLELVQSMSGDKRTSLLHVIDHTKTPGGARLLRRRLLAPLLGVEAIRRRLDQVELFVVHAALRAELGVLLGGVGDLERLATRAELGEANPRDLGALRDGLSAAAEVVRLLSEQRDESMLEALGLLASKVDCVAELQTELSSALVERPPALPKDGGVFLPSYDGELARLDTLRKNGTQSIVELEARLRTELDLPKLKIRYTRVFGWYVEVGRSQAKKVPGDWRRKQTVASGERYTLPELDELSEAIGSAEDRHRERELELIRVLVARAAEAAPRIKALAQRVSRWDVSASHAELAHRHDYCRPEIDESKALVLEDARHPVVERLAALGRFVPNDVALDADAERLWIVTGPNMAGKSTLLRQVALITVLAQMGAFVPARRARVGLVDRVLSRVGASDNLARGESTFMVEMRETADILRSASDRSLVILDEIGRGTSTFDGLAIAWAVAEHLDEAIGCRALFATHYHELTALGQNSEHVANHSVSARELDGDIVFLHRLVSGAASRSYGIAVAKLAGIPEAVLGRARGLLESFEGTQRESVAADAPRPKKHRARPQLDLFATPEPDAKGHEVLDTLRNVDVDRLTPLDALKLLARMKKKL
ncbi:MAG: DNA mismatch repair protein MutS [Myxococcales bacterium]|nr:DNA mismatch repair protein MutS [Myxococcales bacterium]